MRRRSEASCLSSLEAPVKSQGASQGWSRAPLLGEISVFKEYQPSLFLRNWGSTLLGQSILEKCKCVLPGSRVHNSFKLVKRACPSSVWLWQAFAPADPSHVQRAHLSPARGAQKAGRAALSGTLKSSTMGSVNSANGSGSSRSSRCPSCFISWRSLWQKVYWTLTVSPCEWFLSLEQHLRGDVAWLTVRFGSRWQEEEQGELGEMISCRPPWALLFALRSPICLALTLLV